MNRCGLGGRVLLRRTIAACGLLLLAGLAALHFGAPQLPPAELTRDLAKTPSTPFVPAHTSPDQQEIRANFAQLPLAFEANQGQTDSRVKFLARGSGYGLFLTSDEAVLSLRSGSPRRHSHSVVRMQLAGASSTPAIEGTDQLAGKSNYFLGNDPAKWRRGIPQYGRVRYHSVYPGIDLVYYGKQGKLEYDFEVSPGSDPGQVNLRFQGMDSLAVAPGGALILKSAGGEVQFEAPDVYQQTGDRRQKVAGRFVLRGKDVAGFELGAYDRSRALVIDPVLTYSTYLGGSGAEALPSIAVDLGFNVYISGTTTSSNFPDPTGTSPTLDGPSDVFVTKLNTSGSALLFTTYVGGSGTETGAGVGIDSGFDVAIAGTTDSTDFPVINNFVTPTLAAGNHAFVTEIDSSGSALLYSTYLGGNGNETAGGVAVDTKNKIFVTGTTTSTNFPTTSGAFQVTSLGNTQLFLSKIDPSTTGTQSLLYSTYFGGGNPVDGVINSGGVAVDSSSNAYITGSTNFIHTGANTTTDFPILNAIQGCLNEPANPSPCPATTSTAPTDIFIAKISPAAAAGSQLQYSTYLGGSGNDTATAIAVDSSGDAYVTGATNSTDWNIPSEVLEPQSAHNCTGITVPTPCPTTDAYLAKLGVFTLSTTTTTTGTVPYAYFTYLGGSSNDTGLGVAVDSNSGARITGSTDSADFPVTTANALQTASGGGTDAFVTRIDTLSTTPTHYISYLGGSGTDRGTGIAVDSEEAAYVTGDTTSTNFPVATPLQATPGGSTDAFVSKFGPTVNLSMTAAASPTPSGVGNAVTFTYTITNNGDLTSGLTFTDTLSGSATLTSATSSTGSCGTATGTPPTVTCSIGTINTSNTTTPVTATVTLQLTPTSSGPLGNTAKLTVLGSSFSASASATANISDFAVAVSPASQSTPAGTPITYTATVTPTGGFPNNVSISCSAGLPTGAACTVTNNPITSLNTGAQSRAIVVNTTARTTTTSRVFHARPFYVAWLPMSGLALFGFGFRGRKKWRWLAALVLGAFLALTMLQLGCGSSSTTTTTTGTPAGTYTVAVSATSGSASRTTTMQLVVQ